jgi:hypothetical protein
MRMFLFSVSMVAACAAPQKPFQFSAQSPDAIGVVTRTFAAQGQSVEKTDPQNGIIQTAWSDTGFGYGFVENAGQSYGATIRRRYTVIIAGKDVTLRADTKKCANVPATGEVCKELDGLVPKHQEELNQLGATLQQAMQ